MKPGRHIRRRVDWPLFAVLAFAAPMMLTLGVLVGILFDHLWFGGGPLS